MDLVSCKSCGGVIMNGKQVYHHIKKCREYKQEQVDHIRCKECGYKTVALGGHLRLHEMTKESYLQKHPGSPITCEFLKVARGKRIKETKVIKPTSQKRGAKHCVICDSWYQPETSIVHYQKCIGLHPDKYTKGVDFVACPDCNKSFLTIGKHLRIDHGWSEDKIAVEKMRGLQLSATKIVAKRNSSCDFETIKTKRERTCLEKYGVTNYGATKESNEKSKVSSNRRYGKDHAMQTEEVLIKQNMSAQNGPSGLEQFFIDNVCSTFNEVVYTGKGSRIVGVRSPVDKYGKQFYNLNPDFMIFKDNGDEAKRIVEEGKALDSRKFTSKYVIELLGEWYHNEQKMGTDRATHQKQIEDAYASVGISCLVLWEKDVMENWQNIKDDVLKWINKALLIKDS